MIKTLINSIIILVFLTPFFSCGNSINEKYTSAKDEPRKLPTTPIDGKENDISKKMKEDFQLTDMYTRYTNPHFSGGKDDFNTYVKKKLIIPDAVKIGGNEGAVSINVMLNNKGELVTYEVKKIIENCPECTSEAIKLVKNMPPWVPSYEVDRHGNKLKPAASHTVVNIDFRK